VVKQTFLLSYMDAFRSSASFFSAAFLCCCCSNGGADRRRRRFDALSERFSTRQRVPSDQA